MRGPSRHLRGTREISWPNRTQLRQTTEERMPQPPRPLRSETVGDLCRLWTTSYVSLICHPRLVIRPAGRHESIDPEPPEAKVRPPLEVLVQAVSWEPRTLSCIATPHRSFARAAIVGRSNVLAYSRSIRSRARRTCARFARPSGVMARKSQQRERRVAHRAPSATRGCRRRYEGLMRLGCPAQRTRQRDAGRLNPHRTLSSVPRRPLR